MGPNSIEGGSASESYLPGAAAAAAAAAAGVSDGFGASAIGFMAERAGKKERKKQKRKKR